jgi:hypothetical protein
MPSDAVVLALPVIAPETATDKVSVPAPPTKLSPEVRVPVAAASLLTLVNVSLPAPPVNAVPVSRPVVSV